MFHPNISLTGNHPRVMVNVPFGFYEYPRTTVTQKMQAVVHYLFQAMIEGMESFYRTITWTCKVIKPKVEMGCYKLQYRLPMLARVSQFKKKQSPYVILALDGGGVRAKASLAALKMIESEIGDKLIKVVDCIAGVSAGGIIASALSVPSVDNPHVSRYSAKEVDELFGDFAQKIFAKSVLRNVRSLWGAIDSKYPSPQVFMEGIIGNLPLKASLAKKIIITSLDLISGKLVFFENGTKDNTEYLKSKNIDSNSISNDATFCEAVEATSAAPTFFPSKAFRNFNLADGGIAENNPAQIATLLAMKEVAKDCPILVISIGTGKLSSEPIKIKNSLNWGWVQWVGPLIDYLFDTRSQQTDAQMLLMAENNPLINYVRFQMILDNSEEAELDNATPENLQRLEDLGTRTFKHFLDNGGRESIIIPLKQKLAGLRA